MTDDSIAIFNEVHLSVADRLRVLFGRRLHLDVELEGTHATSKTWVEHFQMPWTRTIGGYATDADLPLIDIEVVSARLHDIYQKEAHRRGDIRHADDYADLAEGTKDWDRVLAKWILMYWTPRFDPTGELPAA